MSDYDTSTSKTQRIYFQNPTFFKAYPTNLSKTLLSTISVNQTEFYFAFDFKLL